MDEGGKQVGVQGDGGGGRGGDGGEERRKGDRVVACKGPGGARRGAADRDGAEHADAEDLVRKFRLDW